MTTSFIGAVALTQGMVDDQRLQLADQVTVAPVGQVGVDPLLDGGGPELLEPNSQQDRQQ